MRYPNQLSLAFADQVVRTLSNPKFPLINV
jgi:hypothetical protein